MSIINYLNKYCLYHFKKKNSINENAEYLNNMQNHHLKKF